MSFSFKKGNHRMKKYRFALPLIALTITTLACSLLQTPSQVARPTEATATFAKPTSVVLPPAPVKPGADNPDEPVVISGNIPYTSPFFLASTAEPFVMLEDEAGFVRRDREFVWSLPSQVIGPVDMSQENNLTFSLSLPAVPQGTVVDVDQNGKEDKGVQVFAVAYWSNTWRDTFLEKRDGVGWSTAYASTITDPENDYEITGGTLVVWSPDDGQSFPTGFGADGKLFTEDDPVASIPAGYNLVDLNQKPFRVYKEANPVLTLTEGSGSVKDYSAEGYGDAFKALFEKASREYPFTAEKKVDWQKLKDQFVPQAEKVSTPQQFYRLLRDFANQIPDGHIGASLDRDVFFEDYGGGFGLVLSKLSDNRVIATQVLPDLPAAQAGVQPGAEIVSWDGKPPVEAIAGVTPGFGPYSTDHARQAAQVNFLTRVPTGAEVEVAFTNPGGSEQKATLQAVTEYDSLFKTLPGYDGDKLALPVEARTLEGSRLGYIRINTFQDDYNLMARLWERNLQNLIDNVVPGLIIDVRANSGGSSGLAKDFASFFFDKEFLLYQNYYYNENSGAFEATKWPTRIEPAPQYYDKPIAVLVSSECISACEGFAYAMQQQGRSIIVGHTPTAGAYGEVGLGQYKLPGDLTMQFPTGRSQTEDGQLVLEGVGVVPDVTVPVTADSALGKVDAVLDAAVQALLDKIK